MKQKPKLVKPPLTYKPKMLELSDRRTGNSPRRMAEKAKRHPFKNQKISTEHVAPRRLGKPMKKQTKQKTRTCYLTKKLPQQRSPHFLTEGDAPDAP